MILLGAGCLSLAAADYSSSNETAAAATAATNGQSSSSITNADAQPANVAQANASNTNYAPELGLLTAFTTLTPTNTAPPDQLKAFQLQLELGREQRSQKNPIAATQTLVALLKTNTPPEIKRLALFELALVAQDDNQFVKAQQIFAQYLAAYPGDPSLPEVLLRQGLIYRQMGVNSLAVSKFYAVMSSSLKLKLDNMDYYKKLVLQAQIEIADTYYLEGKYDDAADYFNRIIKTADTTLNRAQIQFKQIRSLSFLTNHVETVAKAQVFLDLYTNSADVPEVRFILATSLKKLGRNHEALKQVLLLLQAQEDNARNNPETWIYWQQRAGNEIANQLYKEGDYLSALQIYLSLADLNKSPEWQLPVWYQTGLVYEQLQQWPKADEIYQRIQDGQKTLTNTNTSPSLASLLQMAKWRKDYIEWMQKARLATDSYQPVGTNAPAAAASP